jgi:hypothetical protein
VSFHFLLYSFPLRTFSFLPCYVILISHLFVPPSCSTHFSLSLSCSDFVSCPPSLNNPTTSHWQYPVSRAEIFVYSVT